MSDTKNINADFETLDGITNILTNLNKIYNRLSVIGFIISLSGLIYFLLNKYFDLSALYTRLLESVVKPSGLWSSVLIVFLVGILLSIFKRKQQFWYGILETVFALVSCYFAVKSIKPSIETISILLTLGSVIYLIVRGLSNVSDGVKKPYWTKNEILVIGNSINAFQTKSLTNLLKDKKVLVSILSNILRIFTPFM